MKPSLRKLFLTNLYLSAFTFGGGYVIITLMKKSSWTVSTGLMNRKCWIWWPSPSPVPAPLPSMEPLWWISDGGNPGTLISVLATVLPPFVILSLISLCYTAFRSNDYVGWMLNGMQSGVAAVIAQVVVEMTGGLVRDRRWLSILVLCAAFLASYVLEVNAALIILAAAVFGLLTRNLNHKKDHQTDQTKKEETS